MFESLIVNHSGMRAGCELVGVVTDLLLHEITGITHRPRRAAAALHGLLPFISQGACSVTGSLPLQAAVTATTVGQMLLRHRLLL